MEGFNRVLAVLLILPAVFVSNNLLGLVINRLFGLTGGLWFFAAAILTQAALLIGFTLYLAISRLNLTMKDLGIDWKELFTGLKRGLVYGPVVFFLVTMAGALTHLFFPSVDEVQPFAQMVLNAGSMAEILVLSFLAVILAPLSEELYFRGLLFGVLKEELGLQWGVLLSGLVFGLMHFDLFRLLPLGIGGMALAWLYQKSGSLFAPITAHGVWNGLMLIILLLYQMG